MGHPLLHWGGFRAPRALSLARGLLLVLLMVAAPATGWAAPGSWSVTDADGGRWSLRLFEQPDPGHPPGWRLRLTALAGEGRPDHRAPLAVDDGLGHDWLLASRSTELVPPPEAKALPQAALTEAALPPASAQFDADDLRPRPADAMPLQLTLPLAGGGEGRLTLGADVVEALHGLP